MSTLTEGPRNSEFILSEANGQRSRENGTAGADLKAGEVVKKSGNNLVPYDGSGTVVGAAINNCSNGDAVAFLARDAEVKGDYMSSTEQTSGEIEAGAIAGLLALGIVVR